MRTFTIAADRLAELRAIPLFADLTDGEITVVDNLATEVTVEAGRELIRHGNYGRQAFILVAGQAAVTVDGERVATLGPGDIAGEVALLDGGIRTATVTTETKARVLVLDPRSFTTMLEGSTITKRIMAALARRLRTADTPATIANAYPPVL